jgi:hypothetical protein
MTKNTFLQCSRHGLHTFSNFHGESIDYIYLTLRKIPWFDETQKFITVFTEGFHGHCPGPVQFFTPHFSGNILILSSHVSSGPPPPFLVLICPMHDTCVHLIPFGLTNNTNNKVHCIKRHRHTDTDLQFCVLSSTRIGTGVVEAVRTSETSVDNYFTRQYIPENNSEYHIFSLLYR